MTETKTRKTFELRDENGNDIGHFKGKTPRAAALKAARRGHTDIQLRERGRRNADKTYSIHLFNGSRSEKDVEVTDATPQWMKDKAVDGKVTINVPKVKKTGVKRIKTL